MKTSLIAHAVVGCIIFVIGGSIHDFLKLHELGDVLAYGGAIYASLSLAIWAYRRLRTRISASIEEKAKSKAHE